jgi:PPM family protein phosphatase
LGSGEVCRNIVTVRRCPSCGAACGDEDVFCEADGTRIEDEAGSAGPVGMSGAAATGAVVASGAAASGGAASGSAASGDAAAGASAAPCPSCGAAKPDDGDGYCSSCGHRLSPHTPSVAPPSLRPGEENALAMGTKIEGFRLLRIEPDGAVASAPGGAEVLLVLSDATALGVEADAIEKLGGEPGFPKLVARGGPLRTDGAGPPAGDVPFLALSLPPPSAKPLAEVAHAGGPSDAVRLMEALLELAGRVERAGYAWEPLARDVHVLPDGSLTLSRLRSAEKLTYGPRLDAKAILEGVADAFLPLPAVRAPLRLVRLLVPHRDASMPAKRSLATCLVELRSARVELDAPPPSGDLAQECDPGLWRPYNQDATAVCRGTNGGDPWVVIVVCDGVSSSARAEEASSVAAKTACDALAHFARSPDISHETTSSALAASIRAAHLAICAENATRPGTGDLPGTTIVAALVYRRRLTVGWVGDSRAYWVGAKGAELLTLDHSWVNEALARGEITRGEDVTGPLAHTITRCLGPLEVGDVPSEVEPDVRTRELPGPGLVLLCSDGLWNYVNDPADMLAMVRSAGERASAAAVVRVMMNYALARGGQDNVSVAVHAFA